MSNHTPGPWSYKFNPNIDLHPRIMAGPLCVASTAGTKTTKSKITTEQKSANAKLISAAPVMLQTLRALRAFNPRGMIQIGTCLMGFHTAVNEAIDLAEGRTE